MRIGLVTCRVLPEPDPDAAILDAGLRERGHEPVEIAWDGDGSLDGVAALVLRSCWNYHERPGAFLGWIERAARGRRLINPPQVVRWNIHKSYLLALEAGGTPIVPTALIERGGATPALAAAIVNRFGDVVIKPAIGAGSAGTRRFGREEHGAAADYLTRLAGRGDTLVQPYLDGFRAPGERSLIWIDGEWTHAVCKRPRFDDQEESVCGATPPTREELAVAQRALDLAPGPVFYARADLVADDGGRVALSELELIEPSLYFEFGPGALERFAALVDGLSA